MYWYYNLYPVRRSSYLLYELQRKKTSQLGIEPRYYGFGDQAISNYLYRDIIMKLQTISYKYKRRLEDLNLRTCYSLSR